MKSFPLRSARPAELQALVVIDDEASTLYAQAGIPLLLEGSHPFVIAENSRWERAIGQGQVQVAVDGADQPVGFVALGIVDGEPYIDQLAVRPACMRQGIGTALLRHAIARHAAEPLWLATYSHVPWNRPYYERHGFQLVPDDTCGPELGALLEAQRAALAHPDRRIAMLRRSSRARDGAGPPGRL